jgi:penicillin V acylase-like amidase (Ntn superfamily)
MCTRVLFETSSNGYVVGRSMDWMEDTRSNLWAFPRGMARDGGTGAGTAAWTARHGSLIATIYDVGTVDGINEAGLVGNVLYLAEAEYGAAPKPGQESISIGAWLQYVLDHFSTVEEAVAALAEDRLHIVAPTLPNGSAAVGHLAISDPSGDSAVVEYVGGTLVIHHGRDYTVMTNSPTYDQQLAITTYWGEIGGDTFLPGTSRAADRFARASYYVRSTSGMETLPGIDGDRAAAATVFSIVRAVSVPLGMNDPEKPNIASTIWRTVADHAARRYYFESAISPDIFWVDLANLDLSEGQPARKLDLTAHPIIAGEASSAFVPAEPFRWLSAEEVA